MKRVIDGKLYDTDEAKGIAAWVTEYADDPQPEWTKTVLPLDDGHFPLIGCYGNSGRIEQLYKTPKRAFMLHVTEWDFEDMFAVSEAEALKWCERRRIDADAIAASFKVETA